MQLSDRVTLAAPRDRVVSALTDPAMLQVCIPGCTSVRALEGDRFEVEMSIPTGLRPFRLSGVVRVDTALAPESLTFLRGTQGRADITLTEDGDRTILAYEARAEISGRATLLGGRAIRGVAKRIATAFLARLGARLSRRG